MFINGVNDGQVGVKVDKEGKLQARAVSISEQAAKAILGDTYNLNTGDINVTANAEVPLFYFKNVGEDKPMVVTRLFVTFLSSTGGVGAVRASVEKGVSGGGILSQDLTDPQNFNFGSSKLPNAEFRIGDGTALTFTGGTKVPEFLFTSDNQQQLITFDAIILPRGASMSFTFTPPVGNSGIIVQAGANVYIDGDF